MTKDIKIIIADDHPVFRDGLKHIVENELHIKIIGEAGEGEEALALILEKQPDIAVLDIEMPKKDGLSIAKELRHKNLDTKIILLTMYKEAEMFEEAMELGIEGYVLKESAVDDIVDCINSVADGNYYISPLISNLIMKRQRKIDGLHAKNPSIENLTPTERRILKLIAENKTSKEISKELFISYRTVNNHRNNIGNKLNLHGALSLIKFAIENKSLL